MSSVHFFSKRVKRVALFAISSIALLSIKWLLGDPNDTAGNNSVFPTAQADVISGYTSGECESDGGAESAEGSECCCY